MTLVSGRWFLAKMKLSVRKKQDCREAASTKFGHAAAALPRFPLGKGRHQKEKNRKGRTAMIQNRQGLIRSLNSVAEIEVLKMLAIFSGAGFLVSLLTLIYGIELGLGVF